ncbi:uncharacterized protein E0L32_000162 [Thyridium curvatum]|uniref:Cytochrome P450 n=1 Tax=Thyridium curvatum TaxID=1093900 RepID=A0A507BGJ2_9PEZI|nr:uncharacterized protein E0L32_000162 [Thyridium curvatum]TPX15828.1 hypothetical protein E0L32_000162 [Thyridium curvatum]
MQPAIALALGTALVHFAAVILIDRVRRYRALAALSRKHRCAPAQRELPWDLLGLYKVWSAAKHVIAGDSLKDAERLFASYGQTYASCILGQRVFFTCHPRNMRQVLVSRFQDFDSSKGIRDHLFRPITARGIFALDGEDWKAARGLFRDLFSHTRTLFDIELQERCFQNLLVRLEHEERTSGKAMDLQPRFLDLMLDLTTAFAMGESSDVLRLDQSAEKKEFVAALLYVKKTMARDGFLGPVHVFLSKKEFHRCCGTVHRFVERVIRERLESKSQLEKSQKSTPDGGDASEHKNHGCLLDGLMESSTNVLELRDGVVTILIAGIDSVASLLSTTFFLIARDQRVFDKLRESILTSIGHEQPTYESLRNLGYLRHVFNETMRVYPPVPFNARTANTDTVLAVGGGPHGDAPVLVKKGERVVFSSWGSHRSLQNFGDDAHEFRPERWDKLQAETLGFIPFNQGPRACPGRGWVQTEHYALMEASYATVRLLQIFSSVKPRDEKGWRENLGLNLSNLNGTVVELVRDPAAPAAG